MHSPARGQPYRPMIIGRQRCGFTVLKIYHHDVPVLGSLAARALRAGYCAEWELVRKYSLTMQLG